MHLVVLVRFLFDAPMHLYKYPVFYFHASMHFSVYIICITAILLVIYTFNIYFLFCWIALLAVLDLNGYAKKRLVIKNEVIHWKFKLLCVVL